MNDLNGLDWSTKPAAGQRQASNTNSNFSAFSTLGATPPLSGRASPAVQNGSSTLAHKSSTPSDDSFSNLTTFNASASSKNLPLQEQQKRLTESKLQQLVNQKSKLQEQWAGSEDAWNNLGSGRNTPNTQVTSGAPALVQARDEDDDLFAAFNKPTVEQTTSKPQPGPAPIQHVAEDDDDPFGLSEFQARQKSVHQASKPKHVPALDDDDILGDLGRPVSERPAPKKPAARTPREPSPDPLPSSDQPQDKAVAELVDMGFPAGKAKRALEATDTGMNVQAAVGLLLNQAHEEARQKSRGREPSRTEADPPEQPARLPQPRPSDRAQAGNAAKDRSSTPSNDPAKAAQELGAAFMKSAGSFWKTAQKSVQQAVSEFNSDNESGSNQPKWMNAPAISTKPNGQDGRVKQPQQRASQQQQSSTDEAMMLETQRPTPPPRPQPRSRQERVFDSSADTSRDHSPAMSSRLRETDSPQPAFMRQPTDTLAGMMRPRTQPPPSSGRMSLNKNAAEEQASQAYVSSARRRKPVAPVASSVAEDEGDLLEGASSRPTTSSSVPPRPLRSVPPKAATPVLTRPPPQKRSLPPISALALKASHTARLEGNNHFKRGDYSAAHESYTTSLRHIPAQHTLQLVLLTNRALTALKTGQPKLAVTDADNAITLIGPSKGDGEIVDLLDYESPPKPMREYYGKALMRKAEALENLEKWPEAASAWRQCVEDGHGGAAAIQGRARAEKAAAPKSSSTTTTPIPTRKPTIRPPPPPRPAPPVISAKPAAAVNALRAQNQAAERLDDEKFALTDTVSARITGWRGGKEDNLRALLASLDTVLWSGAGWKKLSMADLVLPGKVKVWYMKGIGKCHPDKIPTDATTEQRMIAGAVFSTLNEAWDKFRTGERHVISECRIIELGS